MDESRKSNKRGTFKILFKEENYRLEKVLIVDTIQGDTIFKGGY